MSALLWFAPTLELTLQNHLVSPLLTIGTERQPVPRPVTTYTFSDAHVDAFSRIALSAGHLGVVRPLIVAGSAWAAQPAATRALTTALIASFSITDADILVMGDGPGSRAAAVCRITGAERARASVRIESQGISIANRIGLRIHVHVQSALQSNGVLVQPPSELWIIHSVYGG